MMKNTVELISNMRPSIKEGLNNPAYRYACTVAAAYCENNKGDYYGPAPFNGKGYFNAAYEMTVDAVEIRDAILGIDSANPLETDPAKIKRLQLNWQMKRPVKVRALPRH